MCLDIFHKVGLFFPSIVRRDEERSARLWVNVVYMMFTFCLGSWRRRSRGLAAFPWTFYLRSFCSGDERAIYGSQFPFRSHFETLLHQMSKKKSLILLSRSLLCQNVVGLKNGNARWINNSNINIHTSRKPSSIMTGHNNRPYTPFP